MKIIGGVPKQ
ncbi:hypothetical protein CAEBREN_15285 [Caenorhabditis brenneri]|uniref:Uncharacterized protein n=1 Tax=Caenorhabditis brenneri TaxID=135651 RepID=G0P3T5_CAEBE|nr:hypothetical protein CAEBREN_15285 [Caenorhabditis brenneri]